MIDSLYSQGKPIFREAMNCESDLRRNGCIPANVSFVNGKGVFNGTTSWIRKPIILNGTYTVKFKVTVTDNVGVRYFFDYSDGGVGFLLKLDGGGLSFSSGTSYINGTERININSYIGQKVTVIISGISLNGYNMNFFRRQATATNYFAGECDLIEIYKGTRTAEQVSNDYKNSTFKDIRNGLVFDLDCRDGVIQEKFGLNYSEIGGSTTMKNVGGKKIPYFSINNTMDFGDNIDMGTGDLSYCFWVQRHETGNRIPFGKTITGSSAGRWWHAFGIGDISRTTAQFTTTQILCDSTEVIKNGLWYFICGVYDRDGYMYTYINGKEANKVDISGYSSINMQHTCKLIVGGFSGSPTAANHVGLLSMLRIYNRVLTANEISQLYTSQKPYFI